MITVATALWSPNKESKPFSRHYTEANVCALYRGFKKHLTTPFRFVCWSERERDYAEPIEQRRLRDAVPHYGSLTQCFELGTPTIFLGLDSVVVGNVDHLAAYCLTGDRPAAPRDPYQPERLCNGVVLAPAGSDWIWTEWDGRNDMMHIHALYEAGRIAVLDDLFPGEVVSFKRHVRDGGLKPRMRIVYFHGDEKPHQLPHLKWVSEAVSA